MQIRLVSIQARRGGEEILLGIELWEDVFDAGALATGRRSPGCETRELVLLIDRYSALRPKRGILDEETFSALEEASRFSEAVRVGMRMLSYAPNTKAMLEKKLIKRGYSRQTAQDAVTYIDSKGYMHETEEARREVDRRLARMDGRNQIRMKLYAKGFDNEAIAAAEAYMDEIDFVERCANMIRTRYGALLADPAMHKRMAGALMRNGYTMGEIRAAMRRID